MIQPVHVRMARAALDWTVADLAERAGINKNTVTRYEAGKGILSTTLQAIEEVLAREGVVFEEDDRTYRITIRKPRPK
jgi:transcriptional regulator with XRE-family HTH domain